MSSTWGVGIIFSRYFPDSTGIYESDEVKAFQKAGDDLEKTACPP
jgi:hypothetical protein